MQTEGEKANMLLVHIKWSLVWVRKQAAEEKFMLATFITDIQFYLVEWPQPKIFTSLVFFLQENSVIFQLSSFNACL